MFGLTSIKALAIVGTVGAAALLGTPAAKADHVSFGFGIGGGYRSYCPPPRVYCAPPVVYYTPAPTYYYSAPPVVYSPAPVYYAPTPVYYSTPYYAPRYYSRPNVYFDFRFRH